MSGNQPEHPAPETLAAFGSGKLEPADAVAVEAHIAECEECCETLHGLGNDTFVDFVRQSNALQFDSVDDAGTVGLDEAGNETVSDLPSELTNHPRYRVFELLGKGGMGNVYKAQHSLMNRTVAVKVINREIVKNTQAVERFQREVQSAAQLAHANIVTAYDAEQAGDMHLLVMEYVPGDNLADVVKREGPMQVEQACNYIRQAALGLQHAHDSGMVHRDIKPHNLMVTGDEQVKILDFGLATLADRSLTSDAGKLAESYAASNLTSAGSIMGTPDFISPEQATDASAADIRSDIYSLGCTFFYLLTGRPPFSKGTALDRIKAHSEEEVESIESIRGDIPPELATILRRMMTKDPAQRFQTPTEIADALAPFVDAHRTKPAQERVSSSLNAGHRSWWPPTIMQSAMLAGFAFVLAGIIYVTTDNGALEIETSDDRVEVIIRSVNSSKQGQQSLSEMRIVDTVTGSSAKRLPSGEYVLSLKGDKNRYVIDKDRFVLRRGEKVIVRVTPAPQRDEKSKPAGQTLRTVWANATDVSGKVSPDGRYVAFVDWETRDLAVRNLVDGTNRRLTDRKNSGSRGYANTPVFSPDSKQIAFAWTTGDLRIIDIDGKNQRTLYRNKETPAIFPYDWSPNGSEILAHVGEWDNTRRIVRVSVVDGTSRPVTTLGWNYLNSMMYSPDGKYIAYAATPSQHARHHDIYVVATDGGEATPVVQEPSNDVLLAWDPSGQTILFASDRAGDIDAWLIGFRDGKPEGRPMLAKSNIGDVWPMGMTSSGALYFGADHAAKDIFTADFDPKTGKVTGPLKNISTKNVGANLFPGWSPSGDRIAFASERNRPGQARAISVVSLDSGEEKTLSAPFGYFFGAPRWSPDERLLRVHGVEFANRKIEALYSVNVETEESERLTEHWIKTGEGCSPDGTIAFSISGLQDDGTIKVYKDDLVTDQTTEFDRVVMQTPRPSFQLAVSPDGQKVAYTKYLEEEGAWHIVLRDVDGGNEAAIYKIRHGHDRSAQQLNWTDDGERLLYGEGVSDFVLIPVDGGSPTPIQLDVEDKVHAVALHPSGKRIAINVWQKPKRDVWVLENFLPPSNGDGSQSALALEPRTTSSAPTIEVLETGHKTVSPDLTKVFTNHDDRPMIEDRLSGQKLELSDEFTGPGSSNYAVWSHDSQSIAHVFSTGDDQNELQIRIASAVDGTVHKLPRFNYKRIDIQDWSPDGDAVLCRVRNQDGTFALVTFSVTDGVRQQLRSTGWDLPSHARFSPGGRHVVFSEQRQGEDKSKVYIYDMLENGVSRLTDSSESETNPVWAADGSYVLYTSAGHLRAVGFANGQPAASAWLVRADWNDFEKRLTSGGELLFRKYHLLTHTYFSRVSNKAVSPPARVTPSRSAFAAAWSPDGQRIVYLAGEKLQIVSAEDGRVVETIDPGLKYMLFVYWSNDGKTLAVGPGTGNDPFGVSLYSLGTGESKLLVPYPRNLDKSKRLLPKGFTTDGKEFIVESVETTDDGFTLESLAYSVESGEMRKVPFPDTSPDGNLIARVIKEDAVWKLIVSNRDSQKVTTIAEHPEHSRWRPSISHVRWSPDGEKLSYFVFPDGPRELHVSLADGTRTHKLETGKLKHWSREEVAPVWSPDGSQLTYALNEGPIVETSVLRNYSPQLSEAE